MAAVCRTTVIGYLVGYERLDDGDETKVLQAIKKGMFFVGCSNMNYGKGMAIIDPVTMHEDH